MKYKICKTHFFWLYLFEGYNWEIELQDRRAYRIIICSNYDEIYKYFYQIGQVWKS